MERRVLGVSGPASEEDLAAMVDLHEVELLARSRGLVPLPADLLRDGALRHLADCRVPVYEVERMEGVLLPSLEARLMEGGLSGPRVTFTAPRPSRYRLVPYGSARRGRPRPAWELGRSRLDAVAGEAEPDAWAAPWVEPILQLLQTKVLGQGAGSWALLRAARDAEWAEALQTVLALASAEGSWLMEPTRDFVRDQMEADGYCFDCGMRLSRRWGAADWSPCESGPCRRRRVT